MGRPGGVVLAPGCATSASRRCSPAVSALLGSTRLWQKGRDWSPVNPWELEQLDDIHPVFAVLRLGDVTLRSAKALRRLALGQSSPAPIGGCRASDRDTRKKKIPPAPATGEFSCEMAGSALAAANHRRDHPRPALFSQESIPQLSARDGLKLRLGLPQFAHGDERRVATHLGIDDRDDRVSAFDGA